MLARLFNIFETTEIQLTPNAIKRLRWSALLAIPTIPSFAAIEFLTLSGATQIAVIILGAISMLAMIYCFSTRMANRLWIPEKYLDEVEIDRKRRSGSLTYQLLIACLMLFIPIMVMFYTGFDGNAVAVWNGREITFLLASIFTIALSVQTAIAAWMTQPLSDDSNVEKVPMDARYKWIMGAVIIVLLGGTLMAGPLAHI